VNRGRLTRNTETVREFIDRGRRASAESLDRSARAAARQTATQPRSPISPASPAQRAAVAGQACINCGAEASEYVAIDPAHLWPRGRGGCDDALCVLPLCRRYGGRGCHRLFDDGELELLRIVIRDYGRWRAHLQHALEHCTPVELVERLAAARTQWSDVP
jgi:hypothetical protein